jgi:hypothetical protein
VAAVTPKLLLSFPTWGWLEMAEVSWKVFTGCFLAGSNIWVSDEGADDEAENLGENKVESVEGLMNLWGKLPLYAIDAQVVGS